MSTCGDICFIENGQKYCSYSHSNNYPDSVLPYLVNFLVDEGYEEYVRQLKEMGPRGGMSSISYEREYENGELGEWYNDRTGEELKPWDAGGLYNPDVDSATGSSYYREYSYVVHPDLTIDIYKNGNQVMTVGHRKYLDIIFNKEEWK